MFPLERWEYIKKAWSLQIEALWPVKSPPAFESLFKSHRSKRYRYSYSYRDIEAIALFTGRFMDERQMSLDSR